MRKPVGREEKGNTMGLFSNFMKDVVPDLDLNKVAKTVSDVANVANQVVSAAKADAENAAGTASAVAPVSNQAAYAYEDTAPSGCSWGPNMPAEENQFNYPGTYLEYFDGIFRTEFSEYTIERTSSNTSKPVTLFTFWRGAQKALVVELMPQSSCARKQRSLCASQGIPYLRFYYDHDGWWNTRSYVVTRTRTALGC